MDAGEYNKNTFSLLFYIFSPMLWDKDKDRKIDKGMYSAYIYVYVLRLHFNN